MRKKILLFGITLAAMLSSCYGPNDSVYTEDLDVVISRKKDNYDFTTKSKFYISDTITYQDENGEWHKAPDKLIPKEIVGNIVDNVRVNMTDLGWEEITSLDEAVKDKENSVFLSIIMSKRKVEGGGYYPIYPYPGWDWWWGYPGWGYWDPWVPYYYSYSTASVDVSMREISKNEEGKVNRVLIWETFLNGYARNILSAEHINNGIDIGFEQSSYLDIRK